MPKVLQPVQIQTRLHLITKAGKSENVWISGPGRLKKAA